MAIIDKPSDYFNTKLYTGNGSTNAITGVGFQPDLIWIKDRDTSGNSHIWTDSVRGNTKNIYSNLTNAEGTKTDRVTSFDSDGFTLGADASQGANDSGSSQVSWNWLASNTTTSNTDGSITSTVSANTTSGFSIVSYTGTGNANETVGHGLGVAPSMIIVKRRTGDAGDWRCYHKSLGEDYLIRLNLTNASLDNPSWNDTAPTSSVFSIGTNGDVNTSGGNHIAYCFADTSMSKMGSYTGNGSTNGSYIHLGFKPAWIMVKRTSASGDNWIMFDNKRDEFNVTERKLEANDSGAEAISASHKVDFLSNGFKMRAIGAGSNASGSTYIYMAFAENPFVTSTGVPTTAR